MDTENVLFMSYILKRFSELLSQQAENHLAWEDLTHLTAHSNLLLLRHEYFSLDNRNKTNERGQHHKVRSRINFDISVNPTACPNGSKRNLSCLWHFVIHML